MNLHNLGGAVRAFVWCQPTGRNGQAIGRAEQKGYHLYPVTRSEPTPMGTRDANYRQYWHPWNPPINLVDPKRPLCGEIRTTARAPYLSTWAWTPTRCRDCARLATGKTGTLTELNATDPWETIQRHLRPTTPDPVTGR
jgi:hypothetical protein